MTKTIPHLAYRPDVDGLRAVAVLAVVVFHAFPAVLPGGFVGVDVFFVISGFLITSIILKGLDADRFSFADFYARRIRRIFPALLLVVLGALLIGWVVLLPGEYAQLGKHAFAGLGFVANFAFWQEAGYFDTAAELKPLLHLWSLGVEEQFYIVWPAVLVLAWRLRLNLILVSATLAALSLVVCIVMTPLAPEASYFLPFARAWELLAGVLLALVVRQRGSLFAVAPRWVPELAGVAGMALIALAVVLVDSTRTFPGAWALLPVVGAVMLIAAGAQSWIGRRVLTHPLLVGIGLISFPLYLWHWPLLSFVRIVQGEQAGPAVLALAVAVAVVLSMLSCRLLEMPVRQYGGRWAVVSLVLVCVVVGAQGWSTYNRDGLDFRLKGAQAKQEAAAMAWGDELRRAEDCKRWLPEGTPGNCLMADSARAPTAMLVGDSHANHYFWGLSRALQEQGENLMQLYEPGCPPLYGMAVLKDGSLNSCPRPVAAAIDHAVSSPEITTVFLAGRWMAYATGRDIEDPPDRVSSEPLVLLGVPGGDQLTRAEVFTRALSESLRRLNESGKHVVFLHAVPELPFHARECITWQPNRFVQRTPRPECAVERELSRAYESGFRPQLDALLQAWPQLSQFDPASLMCDAQACYGRRDGLLLFRDYNHLSLDGSLWLGRQMAPLLSGLLGRTPARDSEELVSRL